MPNVDRGSPQVTCYDLEEERKGREAAKGSCYVTEQNIRYIEKYIEGGLKGTSHALLFTYCFDLLERIEWQANKIKQLESTQ